MALVVVVALVGGAVLATVLAVSDDGPQASPPPGGDGRVAVQVDAGPAEVGQPAPGFTVPGLNGGRVSLDDHAGVPVIVNFWASWCHPCREEFPLLKQARKRHADAGLEVIGVSYRDIASDGRAFAREQGADWPLARDPDGAIAAAYGVRAIPQTFFVDADGNLVSRVFGITSAKDLEAEIRRILPKSAKG